MHWKMIIVTAPALVPFNEDVVNKISSFESNNIVKYFGERDLLENCSGADFTTAKALTNGTGGVYSIPVNTETEDAIVFKPSDEENETTGGTGFWKEYAAYLIDKGLAGVPKTGVAIISLHNKEPVIGSIQKFVKNCENAEDYGSGMFNTEDIHRIGILDIRILNCDRHSGNLLRNVDTGALVPIDHGTSFPSIDQLENVSYEWMYYPQAKEPFSPEILEEIENIDPDEDLQLLRSLPSSYIGISSIIAAWAAATLLKIYARNGKTLYDIGSALQRSGDRSQPSVLENLLYIALTTGERFATLVENTL